MELFEYEDIFDEVVNSYECNFFHMKVDSIDLKNMDFAKMSPRDLGIFIHEYVHYLQQITAPFGLAYSIFFIKEFLFCRDFINRSNPVVLPIKIDEQFDHVKLTENNLRKINGSTHYNKSAVDEIFIKTEDIIKAKEERTAVNIGVRDIELHRTMDKGFDFGYNCIIESMAHMIQSFINPDLRHNKVPYVSAQIVCQVYCPEIAHDTKLLISICYSAIFFDNPGVAFFTMVDFARKNPDMNGQQIFKIFMTDFSRKYKGVEMPAYRMMHSIIDDFIMYLQAVIGTELVYYKKVLNNCKLEASSGESKLLDIIYNGDISKQEDIEKLISFYGIPCIDSSAIEPFIPGEKVYLETATLISFELLIKRFKEKDNSKKCVRFERCNKFPRVEQKTSEECLFNQWQKTEKCLFTNGLRYWEWDKKEFE